MIKITKRSLVTCQFGDDSVITLDIIEVSDQWHEINFALRVQEGDSWVLPANKVNEFAVNRLNFVQSIASDAYAKLGKQAPILSRMEAEEFIHLVQEEAKKLRNFISEKKDETSSVPENTAQEVVFSQ